MGTGTYDLYLPNLYWYLHQRLCLFKKTASLDTCILSAQRYFFSSPTPEKRETEISVLTVLVIGQLNYSDNSDNSLYH